MPGRVPAEPCSRPPTRRPTAARAGARRSHRLAVRDARPGRLDRPRPGLRHRDGAGDDLCCTTPSPTSAGSSTTATPLDHEAWHAGRDAVPARRQGPALPAGAAEGAASLLPDGPRPAVVFTVRVAPTGTSELDGVERALVRSRAKLAYETVSRADLPADSPSWPGASTRAEDRPRRGRVSSSPEQEVGADSDRRLRACASGPASKSRTSNAALSLATNLAVADALLAAAHRAVPGDGRARRARRASGCATRRARSASTGRRTQSLARLRSARSTPTDPRDRGVPAGHPPGRRRRALRAVPPRRARRGTRRWPRPTPTPPRRCAASPTATCSRRRWRSATVARCPTTSPTPSADLPAGDGAGDARASRSIGRSSTSPRPCCCRGPEVRGVRRRRGRRGPSRARCPALELAGAGARRPPGGARRPCSGQTRPGRSCCEDDRVLTNRLILGAPEAKNLC